MEFSLGLVYLSREEREHGFGYLQQYNCQEVDDIVVPDADAAMAIAYGGRYYKMHLPY